MLKKKLKYNYLFFVLIIIYILRNSIYGMFFYEDKIYNTISCKRLEEDYNDLAEFSNINVIYDTTYTNVSVIYKDIYNYTNEITIRGGEDLKFKENYPVIYDNTLIGVIKQVDKNSSVVRLLTNKDTKISININNSIGILALKNNKLVINDISNIDNLDIGMDIYTSGLGNIKENIYIGTISSIEDKKNIFVKYDINIVDIKYVTVIKDDNL